MKKTNRRTAVRKSAPATKTVSRRAKLSGVPNSNLPVRDATRQRRSPRRSDDRSSSASGSPPVPTKDDALPATPVSAAGGSSREHESPEVDVQAADGSHRIADVDLGISSKTPPTEELVIAEIKEMHRRRQQWHRAEKGLILQIKAIERRLRPAEDSPSTAPIEPGVSSDPKVVPLAGARKKKQTAEHKRLVLFATLPLVRARNLIHSSRMVSERRLQTLARQLPLYAAFVQGVHGFGALGFAQIIGEAGDLNNYSNPAKLWKRMGVAVINGQRQRRVPGPEALIHGYDAERRSVLWNIGDSMLKKKNHYKDVYDARKIVELQKAKDEGLKVVPQATIDRAKGTAEEKRRKYRSAGHIHNRSKRYAEKRLLRDLWRAARALKRDKTLQASGT